MIKKLEEKFHLGGLVFNYPYVNAYIVLVSKKHIKGITVTELLEGKQITTTSHNYLGNRKEFDLKKKVIIDFCSFLKKVKVCLGPRCIYLIK